MKDPKKSADIDSDLMDELMGNMEDFDSKKIFSKPIVEIKISVSHPGKEEGEEEIIEEAE